MHENFSNDKFNEQPSSNLAFNTHKKRERGDFQSKFAELKEKKKSRTEADRSTEQIALCDKRTESHPEIN